MRHAAGAFLMVVLGASLVRAQATHLITGVVVAAADQSPLPHAMVSMEPAGRETFTDDHGRFSFPQLSPGTYRIRAIHLGFSPAEQSVTVARDSDVTRMQLILPAVRVRLAAVHITADGPCTAPGAPDPAKQPEFSTIFQQLQQNAQQYRLLADSFPYEYRVARTQYSLRGDSIVEGRRTDTLLYKSDARREVYRAGRVITSSFSSTARRMLLPTLTDFASDEFIKNHCFRYAGEDSTADGQVVRIDFRAWERLDAPDVNGTILLDATSYQIRRADLRLSQIPYSLSHDLTAVSVTTFFGEVEPSVLIFSGVHDVNTMVPSRNLKNYIETHEDHQILDFAFLKGDPGKGVSRP
jgi:hypothetical protein